MIDKRHLIGPTKKDNNLTEFERMMYKMLPSGATHNQDGERIDPNYYLVPESEGFIIKYSNENPGIHGFNMLEGQSYSDIGFLEEMIQKILKDGGPTMDTIKEGIKYKIHEGYKGKTPWLKDILQRPENEIPSLNDIYNFISYLTISYFIPFVKIWDSEEAETLCEFGYESDLVFFNKKEDVIEDKYLPLFIVCLVYLKRSKFIPLYYSDAILLMKEVLPKKKNIENINIYELMKTIEKNLKELIINCSSDESFTKLEKLKQSQQIGNRIYYPIFFDIFKQNNNTKDYLMSIRSINKKIEYAKNKKKGYRGYKCYEVLELLGFIMEKYHRNHHF